MSNVFCATGSLGKDCEVKSTPSGQSVMTFSVANNVGFGDKQKTNWIRCTVWGKRAEAGGVSQYLKKGQQVFVSGELSTSEYTGNDGALKFSIELNCNVINLIGKRDQLEPPQQQQYQQQPAQQGYQTPHQQYHQGNADRAAAAAQQQQPKTPESYSADDIPY